MRSGRYRCAVRGGATPRARSNGIVVRILGSRAGPGAGELPEPERIVGVVWWGGVTFQRQGRSRSRRGWLSPRHGGARDHAMSRLPGLRECVRPPLPVPGPCLRVLLHLPHSK